MKEHRLIHPVTMMCRTLEIGRSGYHRSIRPENGLRARENRKLTADIENIFNENKKRYGSPRVTTQLRKNGIRVGENRVARLMKQAAIRAKTPRKKNPKTTDSRHGGRIAPNLAGKMQIHRINQLWVADITYIRTDLGWCYLAAVLDIYSRKIVGWQMSRTMEAWLVTDALNRAIQQRKPPAERVVHTDRGSQYVSDQYIELLKKHELTASMSAKGNCYDNATMESFFGTLKTEEIQDTQYSTYHEARSSVFEYIELYYNRRRIHTSLMGDSPESFEEKNSPSGEENKETVILPDCRETTNTVYLN